VANLGTIFTCPAPLQVGIFDRPASIHPYVMLISRGISCPSSSPARHGALRVRHLHRDIHNTAHASSYPQPLSDSRCPQRKRRRCSPPQVPMYVHAVWTEVPRHAPDRCTTPVLHCSVLRSRTTPKDCAYPWMAGYTLDPIHLTYSRFHRLRHRHIATLHIARKGLGTSGRVRHSPVTQADDHTRA
jgi:hypothetical protein